MLKIGTRKSELALWQAHFVSAELKKSGVDSELVEIESFGDKIQELPLHKLGNKGVFTKALDDALLSGNIDLAVHSLKDVPTVLEPGLALTAVPKRGNPFDVFVQPLHPVEKNTPRIVATGSIRRKAFWLNFFPDDTVIDLRGNVPTRLQKIDTNGCDGGIFAQAGLERLNLEARISKEIDWMLPAPSQGALGIITRIDSPYKDVIKQLNDPDTELCTGIERAFLNALDAGCSSPVGAYAHIKKEGLLFKAAVLSLDGSQLIEIERDIKRNSATAEHGQEWASMILKEGADYILSGSK